jgi:nucleoside-diphosphate-sugar epimerase
MKIFVAGATGTLGRPVLRLLLSRGHAVVGLTRVARGQALIEGMGAAAVLGDALDADGLRKVVATFRPERVVHLLTALPPGGPLRPADLRVTNTLRTAGTANLLRAAIEGGAGRLVAESFVGVYGGGAVSPASEDDPLPPVGRNAFTETVLALRSLEDQLRTARSANQTDTVALRIGLLYGREVPSTIRLLDQARRRLLVVPRKMSGIGAFVHVSDAAAAIVAAIERPVTSAVYNVVDDEPLALDRYLESIANVAGAPPPRRIPMWVVRLAAPLIAESASTRLVLPNARAKHELGWVLQYPTFASGLTEVASKTAVAV